MNRWKPTSLLQLVEVVKRFKARTPGGEHKKVKDALIHLYGPGKRTQGGG